MLYYIVAAILIGITYEYTVNEESADRERRAGMPKAGCRTALRWTTQLDSMESRRNSMYKRLFWKGAMIGAILLVAPWVFVWTVESINGTYTGVVFDKAVFLQEYHKLLGTFAIVMVGYLFAGKLLDRRLAQEKMALKDRFFSLIELSLRALDGLEQHNSLDQIEEFTAAWHVFQSAIAEIRDLGLASPETIRNLSLRNHIAIRDLPASAKAVRSETGSRPADLESTESVRKILLSIKEELE
jgi:hypothetical protein